ncbi:MAG TPA: hypothetical protein VGQ53_11670 [Chitinophagaceae bacterium]|jgi:hypothetical protein|nr:hypothetical protein [Chitinophagaceae bacterium]
MKQRYAILLGLTILAVFAFRTPEELEVKKYKNYVAAIQNGSTFRYFTVISVKDKKTGVLKDICTKGNFLAGALHIELNCDYSEKGDRQVLEYAKARKDRYFEFSNPKALANISFSDYDSVLLIKVKQLYNFRDIEAEIKSSKKFELGPGEKEMKYVAHLLFNMGYLTGENSCFGGTLEYVLDPK